MTTRYKYGLLGHNIGYSKSADIFKAIFELKKVKGSFETFDLAPDSFETEFEKVIAGGVDGLSVTIPFKKKVIPLLDDTSPVASSLEAVNSIAVSGGKLHGYNTDIFGFSYPLKPLENDLKKSNALILGCGGSAKAVTYALHTDYEISHFTVLGRSPGKLNNFHKSLDKILLNSELTCRTFDEFFKNVGQRFGIIVNCTPVGGSNDPRSSTIPDHFDWSRSKIYYDLNYNDNNKTVARAAAGGLTTFDGSAMLVAQAIRSFEIWSGEQVEFDDVYKIVFGKPVAPH